MSSATTSTSTSARDLLLTEARKLCNDFASHANIDRLLSHYSISTKPVIIEHGNPAFAPFLGREFAGVESLKNYFQLLAQTVNYENMEFVEYIVDVEEKKVVAKGQATFTWKETQQSWAETFVYVLHFDIMYRVTRQEIWADSGAAYLARIGQLNSLH